MTAARSGPQPPAAVLDHIGPAADLIVPLANGEPVARLDAIEAEAERFSLGVSADYVSSLRRSAGGTPPRAAGRLRGRSIRQRVQALIGIAHPDHRDRLRHEAGGLGYL